MNQNRLVNKKEGIDREKKDWEGQDYRIVFYELKSVISSQVPIASAFFDHIFTNFDDILFPIFEW